MTRRRQRRRSRSDLIGGLTTLGAAAGVWAAASRQAHTHPAGRPCPHPEQAGACLGHALGTAVTPYIVAGFAGAFLGLLVAVMLTLLLRAIRLPRSSRATKNRRGRWFASHTVAVASHREAPVSASAVQTGAGATGRSAASRLVAPLTKPELHEMRLKVRKSVLEAMRQLHGGGERSDILARALAIGGFTERELQAPAAARHRNKHQRQIDHDLSWALTDLKRDGLATNPARGTWKLTDAALVEPELPIAEEATGHRLVELRAMPYDDYLRTPEWKMTRAAALVRADHQCAMDPSHTGILEVHHRHYERRGAELPSDLIVLCRACHQVHHRTTGQRGP